MRAEEHEVFRFVLVKTPHVYREWDLALDGSHAQTMSTPLLLWRIVRVNSASVMFCFDYLHVFSQHISACSCAIIVKTAVMLQHPRVETLSESTYICKRFWGSSGRHRKVSCQHSFDFRCGNTNIYLCDWMNKCQTMCSSNTSHAVMLHMD